MDKKFTEKEKMVIDIEPLQVSQQIITVESVPNSSLLMHRIAPETVRKMMVKETQVGGNKNKKQLRDLDAEYKSCFHYTTDGKIGYPASGFNGAMLQAAVASGIPKTVIKRAVRILGGILPIKYKKLVENISIARRSGMTAAPDERHRPEFFDWECDLPVQYDVTQITLQQIYNLINKAGFVGGIGDWRPSSPKSAGTHGMFQIKLAKK